MSTLDVASSRIKNLLFCSKARARHSNCFCPTENINAEFEVSVYNLLGNYINLMFTLSTTYFKLVYSSTSHISCSVLKLKGSKFLLMVPLNRNGVWGITDIFYRRVVNPNLRASQLSIVYFVFF